MLILLFLEENILVVFTFSWRCFQKNANYAGIKIFKGLPYSITSFINKEEQFKVALKIYLITHSFYSVNEFLMFINDS
jgi:hypothetical protein